MLPLLSYGTVLVFIATPAEGLDWLPSSLFPGEPQDYVSHVIVLIDRNK